MKPDIIPGYSPGHPPSREMVELFQLNNALKVDGIIGPKTRADIWRDPGSGYSHFAWHRVERNGAERTRGYCAQALIAAKGCALPLERNAILTLCQIVSSGWKTGFDYLSDQDSLTFGMRRLAAGTARRFITRHIDLFSRHGIEGRDAAKIKDRPDGDWPMADENLRYALICAANDQLIWAAQLAEFISEIRDVLEEQPWARTGRTIALLMRINNSGSGLPDAYVKKYGRNYTGLRRAYIERGGRGASRVEYIERLIPAQEVWR